MTPGQIEEAMAAAGLNDLPAGIGSRFSAYLELLIRWNRRMNLTAIRSPEKIVRRHFIESSFAVQHLSSEIRTLLDFGSGAGFPGIPIAICRPETHVTLAESQSKKAAFLSEAVRVLEIDSVVYAGRVEAMPPAMVFDGVVMRAVDKMVAAIALARPRARHVLALFTTGAAGPGYSQIAGDFAWQEAVQLPNQRVGKSARQQVSEICPFPNAEQTILMIGKRQAG